ncbi:MAG: ergothioneine biosynthesis protein EgtB [Rhodoferax sp.]
MTASPLPGLSHPSELARRYARVRAQSLALATPLSAEDCQAQSMPDASPVKWHLAHVTWFFETFVLEAFEPGFAPFNPAFKVLFNSYYNAVGDKHPRPERGLLTRPCLAEVLRWREAVDERICALLTGAAADGAARLIELGLQHEQQHQELILTDMKHLLSRSGLSPVYRKPWPLAQVTPVAHAWVGFDGGLVQIGVDAAGTDATNGTFAFDNEGPRHTVHLRPYALANRLVTHGEWLDFMQAGGYADPRWWLSAGWDWVQRERILAPLYWRQHLATGPWRSFTLHGEVPIDPHTPITHISYFEADAFARWKAATDSACTGARLPTEAEWEAAVARQLVQSAAPLADGNFAESNALHPMPVARADTQTDLLQTFGDCWEWTSSSYAPYPGYQPWPGAVGEYNGKFMVNQYVLRGGSCASPASHLRASYRNFFPADARWQFSGLRLARDVADVSAGMNA